MKRYYIVKKDTPIWQEGAIISNEQEAVYYRPVNDLYLRDDEFSSWYEGAPVVEHEINTEFFERVYPVSTLGKMLYLSKEKAREATERLFKGDK